VLRGRARGQPACQQTRRGGAHRLLRGRPPRPPARPPRAPSPNPAHENHQNFTRGAAAPSARRRPHLDPENPASPRKALKKPPTRGLDDDVVKLVAPLPEVVERRHEVVAHGAAEAAVGEDGDRVAGALEDLGEGGGGGGRGWGASGSRGAGPGGAAADSPPQAAARRMSAARRPRLNAAATAAVPGPGRGRPEQPPAAAARAPPPEAARPSLSEQPPPSPPQLRRALRHPTAGGTPAALPLHCGRLAPASSAAPAPTPRPDGAPSLLPPAPAQLLRTSLRATSSLSMSISPNSFSITARMGCAHGAHAWV
jgi:hypothetical protein